MIVPHYDGQCGWYEQLHQVSEFAPLQTDERFDTVVIGGGFVGTAAARRMAENKPDDRVLLIEALKIGQGTSGRNSGFVIDQPHKHELEKGDKHFRDKVIKLNRTAIDYLQEQIETHAIDCQWSWAGKYQAAVSHRGENKLKHLETTLEAAHSEYRWLSKADTEQQFGTDYYRAAIFTPGGTLVQPAALMRGLADSMPANVRVVEETPVMSISRAAGGFVLTTQQASIRCRQIILGTNIFTTELGYMNNRIIPVMTFASMTPPLTDEQFSLYSGQLDWGLTPADVVGTTLRMTQDRRLLIRNTYCYAGKYNTPTEQLPKIKAIHRQGFDNRYPQLKHVPLAYTWGGASGFSGNFETFFGKLEEGVFGSACDQNLGAARGTVSGMMLADLACGKDSQLLQDIQAVSGKPSWLPPKPLLRLGVAMRMRQARFSGRAEL